MKILFLLHVPPPIHGSSMVGASILNSERINKAFDCSYVNLLLSRTISETGSKGIKKALRLHIVFLCLLRQLLFNRPQLVYLALTATGAAFYRDVALVALLRLFGVKHLFHLHNKGFSKFGKKKRNDRLYQFVFTKAKVIMLSQHLYEDVSAYVKWENVYICPNGIGNVQVSSLDQECVCTSRFSILTEVEKVLSKKEQRKKNNDEILLKTTAIEVRKVQLLFLSNLIESKGVYVLLEACSLLKQKDIAFECVFVGGEADINVAMFQASVKALDLEQQVQYIGKKYGVEKELVFANADIFAFPTYFETFGIVIIEAMQHNLPVVSTYEGGIPDIVEDGITGFLVPQKDVHALADKLEILMRNSELRKEMGIAGRKKYEEEFTLEKFENRLVKILKEVSENSI